MDLSGAEALDAAVQNCLAYHTNDIVNSVPDERDFLRIWRRRWRDAVEGENLRMLRFLRSATELADDEFMSHIREIPPNSGWFTRHIREDVFDLSGVIHELEERLGVPYSTLRHANHAAQDRYAVVIRRLFELEDALNARLQSIRDLSSQLERLTIIDISGSEGIELQTAIVNYIRGVYRTHAIDDAYREFISCYAEWHALRGMVLGPHIARAELASGPLCSICTTEKITAALVPCGHTFCNSCSQRQRNFCYVCRSNVRERMRIYFV
jgi:hypothetical protein